MDYVSAGLGHVVGRNDGHLRHEEERDHADVDLGGLDLSP